jgi:hypothetical protein
VLKPEIGLTEEPNSNGCSERKSHLPHCVVVTRITVL